MFPFKQWKFRMSHKCNFLFFHSSSPFSLPHCPSFPTSLFTLAPYSRTNVSGFPAGPFWGETPPPPPQKKKISYSPPPKIFTDFIFNHPEPPTPLITLSPPTPRLLPPPKSFNSPPPKRWNPAGNPDNGLFNLYLVITLLRKWKRLANLMSFFISTHSTETDSFGKIKMI